MPNGSLTKTAVDIPISTGLSQKFDARLAPNGISIQALNLVKIKKDTLQKRLGLKALNVPAALQVGLNLGTHRDRLVTFDSIPWPATSQRYWSIGAYSDNTSTIRRQSLIPDVVAYSKRTCVTPDATAFETDLAEFGDFTVQVWTAPVGATLATAVGNLQLFFQVVENRTENIIVPPTIVEPSSANLPVTMPRCFTVGAYVVVTYVINGAQYARAMVGTNPVAGFGARTNFISSTFYDAQSAIGDSNNFVAVGLNQPRAGNAGLTVYKIGVPAFNVVQSGTVTDANLTGSVAVAISSTSVWASTFANGFGVVYTYTDASGKTTVGGAMDSYSSIPASTTGATLNALAGGTPNPPYSISIVNLGTINNGNGGNSNSFGVIWGSPGTLLNGNGANATSTYSAYSQTTYLSFYKNAGTPTITGGGNMPRPGYGVVPVSRMFSVNGVVYVIVCTQSSLQGTYYMCALDYALNVQDPNPFPMRPVATIAPRQALTPNTPLSSYSCFPGNTRTLTSVPQATSLPYNTNVTSLMTTQVGQKLCPTLFNVEMSSKHLYESAMYGQSLVFSSGMPSMYDGVRSVEMGYCWYPEVANVASAVTNPTFNLYQAIAGAGPSFNPVTTNNDVVNYIFTYEWTDAQGQLHISARSAPYSVNSALVASTNVAAGPGAGSPPTLPGKVQIQFIVPTLGIGYRVLPQGASLTSQESILGPAKTVQLGVYRTAVNGTTYYKITDPQNTGDQTGTGTNGSGLGSSFYNVTSAGTITFVDSTNETTLTSNPVLYGDGTDSVSGSVDNLNGPSSPNLCSHKGRIFISDGNNVWYTKRLNNSPGTPSYGMAPAFNETSLMFSVGDGQPVTGMASMDGNLIIFKRRSIHVVIGDGPLDNGNQNDFSDPQPVPTNLGCTDSRSIEVTPEGTYFYSDAGYRVLDRSLTVQYPGTAIENELAAYPVITSAVVHPTSNRMILCATVDDDILPGGTYTSEFISRDYVLDAWTTGIAAGNLKVPVSGMVAAGVGMAPANLPDSVNRETPTLFMLGADGTLWREKNAGVAKQYYDTTSTPTDVYVTSTLQAVDYKADGILGFARCFSALGLVDFLDNCQLTFNVYTDYGQLSNSGTWNQSQLSSTAPAYPEVYLKNQRIKTVSCYVSDNLPTDGTTPATGQGFSIKGFTLNIGVYPGSARSVPADRQ